MIDVLAPLKEPCSCCPGSLSPAHFGEGSNAEVTVSSVTTTTSSLSLLPEHLHSLVQVQATNNWTLGLVTSQLR